MSEVLQTMKREEAVRLFEAVDLRHSMRSYTGEPLLSEHRQKLLDYLENGWEPYPGHTSTRAVLIEGVDKTSKIFKGLLGSYGSVQNAPAMIAMIARIDQPYFYEAIGYMGEQCVLFATSLGLDTCWVGGLFRPEVAAKLLGLAENERVIAVSPVGTAKTDTMASLYEGLFKFGTKRGKRKEFPQISHVEDAEPPRWFYRAVEAVQQAPSSFNKQPWFVTFHKEGRISMRSVVEYKDKHPLFKGAPNMSRLCCGIAMLHLRVASRAFGVEGRWVPEEELSNPIASFYVPELLDPDQL